MLMTRGCDDESERAWDGDLGRVPGRGDAAGAGLCRESRFFFWNQSECRGLSLSGKLSGAEGGNR